MAAASEPVRSRFQRILTRSQYFIPTRSYRRTIESQMDLESNPLLPLQSGSDSKRSFAQRSNCTCYFEPNRHEFPRNTVCVDGCAARVSILERLADLPSGTSSLECICIPSSIATIAVSCFRSVQSLSFLAFEPGSRLSNLGERNLTVPAFDRFVFLHQLKQFSTTASTAVGAFRA
jgi:hypothetical protein